MTALFKQPQGIAAAADNAFYVADTQNNAVRKLENRDRGTGKRGFVDGNLTSAQFQQPSGIAFAGVLAEI